MKLGNLDSGIPVRWEFV